jgi:hypothetical protein
VLPSAYVLPHFVLAIRLLTSCNAIANTRAEAPAGASLGALFVRRAAIAPPALLSELNAGILLHLVAHLTNPAAMYATSPCSSAVCLTRCGSDTRRALTLLLCERCRVRAVLESVGGRPVLEALMNDADPFVG